MDLILIVIILLFKCFHSVLSEACVSQTTGGVLLGKNMFSRNERKFCAFLGISYAAPPVGKLRFLPPQPPAPWEGMKNSTEESVECIQDQFKGAEDCLYLNVFTHSTQKNASNTVMVYIHGGGFRIGSSSMGFLGPEYLMDKDIVLVTLQYRLGPFGFLSTEDKVIPGNMGLKDQVKALQWVQENIEHFGGDRTKVTIFGNSAGGASVHLHMQSPVSSNLFTRGISQSGTALSGFAVASKGICRNKTHNIASNLNCSSIDSRELLYCLQNKTASEVISAHNAIIQKRHNRILLRPVVEQHSDHAFLTSPPEKATTHKPWLVGVSANEGIVFIPIKRLNAMLHQINSSFHTFAPEITFLEKCHRNLQKIVNKIYDFYFKDNKSTKDQIVSLEQLITDSWFVWPTEKAIEKHNGTLYFYLYDHLGEHSYVEFYKNPRGYGVAHIDENLALFSCKHLFPSLNQQDTNISKLMVDFWVNFATYGNPTPDPISVNPQTKDQENFLWEASNNTDPMYLHIQTNKLELKRKLYFDRLNLWRELQKDAEE